MRVSKTASVKYAHLILSALDLDDVTRITNSMKSNRPSKFQGSRKWYGLLTEPAKSATTSRGGYKGAAILNLASDIDRVSWETYKIGPKLIPMAECLDEAANFLWDRIVATLNKKSTVTRAVTSDFERLDELSYLLECLQTVTKDKNWESKFGYSFTLNKLPDDVKEFMDKKIFKGFLK